MTQSTDPLVRNRGIITATEQERLSDSIVAIAGCGGDGGQLAETLARMGVRHFRLADPETFSVENLNRQAGCYYSTLGRNKAEVIGSRIQDIAPDAEISLFTEGVTEQNLFSFLAGASVVVDEMEYTQHHLAVRLAREARLLCLPNVMAMNVAFGCLVTSFMWDRRSITVEEFLGLDPNAPLREIADQAVPLERWIPRLPSYADMEVVAKVAAGEMAAPSVAPGVQLAAGYAAFEVMNYLCPRCEPVTAPRVFWADAQEMSSGILTIGQPVVG